MEQEAGYCLVVNILKDLELQQATVNTGSLEKEYNETKRRIEDHFQTCIEALTARKEALLKEVDEKYLQQNQALQELQTTLNTSVDGCKKILDAGALLYNDKKSTAISIWKSIDVLPSIPQTENASGIAAEFSHLLLNDIKVHGTVYTRSGEGSNSTSLSSSTSSLGASSNSIGSLNSITSSNDESICVVCTNPFFPDSNIAGNCAHKGTWHKKDECKKLKCKKDSNTYHWNCCDSDKYTMVCPASGKHMKPKLCAFCGTKFLYSKPGECYHRGAWHTCLADCNSKCIGLAHSGKQHWSCCQGVVRNENKCSKSEHKCG